MKQPSEKNKSTSLKVPERPKVSFGPYVEKHRSVPGRLKQDGPKQIRFAARGYFTPNPGKSHTPTPRIIPCWGFIYDAESVFQHYFLDQDHHHSPPLLNIRPPSPRSPGLNLSDPSNPILHPPRLSYSSFNRAGGFSQPQKAEQKKRVWNQFKDLFINDLIMYQFIHPFAHSSWTYKSHLTFLKGQSRHRSASFFFICLAGQL